MQVKACIALAVLSDLANVLLSPCYKGGGLAVPLETPVLREFACEWYFNHKDSSKSTALIQTVFSILPASGMDIAAADQRCNIPAIAKLAGEIITAARILNALVSKSDLAFSSKRHASAQCLLTDNFHWKSRTLPYDLLRSALEIRPKAYVRIHSVLSYTINSLLWPRR